MILLFKTNHHREKLEDEKEFEVVGDLSELQPKEEEQQVANGSKPQNGGEKSIEKGRMGKSSLKFIV